MLEVSSVLKKVALCDSIDYMKLITRFIDSIRILVIAGAVFTVLYIILAVRPLGTELFLIPVWTTDITHVQETDANEELFPFKLNKTLGYFTESGKIATSIAYDYKGTVSSNYYTTYNANAERTPFFTAQGEDAGTIIDAGFPFFEDNRIYLFLPGGVGVEKCNADGSRNWIYEGSSPITAFASSSAGAILGFADGNLVSLTHEGVVDQSFAPGGSDYPVILGADMSDDGKFMACVSGQDRPRFVLAEKQDGHSRIIYHEYLAKNQTHQVLVHFDDKGDTVFFNYNGGVGIVSTKTQEHLHVSVPGTVMSMHETSVDDLTFILSRDGENYTISVVEPFASLLGSFTFKAQHAFMAVYNDKLYIGKDSRISQVTVARK